MTCIQTLSVNIGLVLLLLQGHQSTNGIIVALEDSEVMISVVLLLVFISVTNKIMVNSLISIEIFFDVVHSFLHLNICKLISLSIIKILDLLVSLIGFLNQLNFALIKHVSHENESSNQSKDNDSSNDDESSGRCSFIIRHQIVLFFSLDQLFFGFFSELILSLLLASFAA